MNDPVGSAGPVAPESVGAVDALMRTLLPVARGEAPADLVIRNARVANVLSLEYEEADVAVAGGFVVGLGRYEGREVVDAEGQVLIPGMIDGHVHIESSLTTPARFAEVVVPRGTAAVMADPHEIANVWGAPGVRALRDASEGLPLDVFLGAPSCVPASPLETCREPLEASDLEGLFRDGTCSHLGEMMNFPGLIGGDEGVWARVAASGSRPRTAHLPGLRGRELCAYALSGCDGDHETTGLEEAREKLRRGVWIMMREGAASPDLEALAPLVRENPARSSRCLAVSDDVSPTHLRERGHMDHKVRRLCALGVEPLAALRMVTLTPAEYFRLPRRGAVAPGRIADLVLVDSLQTCRVDRVWKGGRLVARGGRLLVPLPLRPFPRIPSPPLPPLSPDRIAPPVREGAPVRVIGARPGSLLTESLILPAPAREGRLSAAPERDLAKLVVRERHRGTGRVAVGLVRGLGLRSGALGASVAHDAHNFIAAGGDDASLLTALGELERLGGGLVLAEGDRVVEALPLPVAGLMSEAPAEEVAAALIRLEAAAAERGIGGPDPCMALSFLSLSVIPALKLTDRGYADLCGGGLLGFLAG